MFVPSGRIFQACPIAGLNWDATIEESSGLNGGGAFSRMIFRLRGWIGYEGDIHSFRLTRLAWNTGGG